MVGCVKRTDETLTECSLSGAFHAPYRKDEPMKLTRSLLAAAVLTALITLPARAQKPEPGVYLTIYNNNFALVKDRRVLDEPLRKGLNIVRFRDVAATIDATSVHFRSLTDPTATVDEQNYEFDLVGANKLLQKYIDKQITVFTTDGRQYEGILMSYDARQLVLAEDRKKGPISMIERGENVKRIQFSQLPGGLLTRPTLVWEITAEKAGKHLVEVSYIAKSIRWRADYNIVLDEDDTAIDLSGWVTLQNNTGTRYADASVKLLAGAVRHDPRRINWGYGQAYYKQMTRLAPSKEKGEDPSRAFGEYRMYKLPEKTNVNNNQIKQVELITAENVPVEKTYLYDGAKVRWNRYNRYWDAGWGHQQNKKVNVLVEFENRAARNLGIAVPAGKCRVYKADSDKSLEFIGEDAIGHTPRDEKVTLYIGDAFDIVGERKQTEFKIITPRIVEEEFEIKIRNHKEEAVTVKVLEKLYRWAGWKVLEKNHEYEQLDSRTIVFPVKVDKDGETVITYRVRYEF